MLKKIHTFYDLQNLVSQRTLAKHSSKDLKDLQIVYHNDENAIEAYFHGKPLESTNCEHPHLDDRVILDPTIHGDIRMKELRLMGTIFQINTLDYTYPLCNTAGHPLLEDYLMWAVINKDPIHVQFCIEHHKLKDKINYPGRRVDEILKYLKKDKDIQILYDGIADAGGFAYLRHQANQIKSAVPIIINQFGPIEVDLNVGFPDTVGELINYVKQYKEKLYKSIG